MKCKIFTALLAVLLVTVSCAKPEENAFAYSLSNGGFRITAYEGEKTEVVVPAEIDKKEVNGLDPKVFGRSQTLSAITLPGSIRTIEMRSFVDCSSLKTVVLAEGTENIESCAFDFCQALEKVSVPASVTWICLDAFRNDDQLTLCVQKDSYALWYAMFYGIPYQIDGKDAANYQPDAKWLSAQTAYEMVKQYLMILPASVQYPDIQTVASAQRDGEACYRVSVSYAKTGLGTAEDTLYTVDVYCDETGLQIVNQEEMAEQLGSSFSEYADYDL